MKVRVLFFSQLRDLCGSEAVEVDFGDRDPGEVTVATMLEELYQRYAKLREWDGSILVAADLEYVDRGARLRDGQEMAIMPPVQGG